MQTFECLNSGPGKAGDTCQNVPGTPTCGDGLACLQTAASGGTCTPYCDPKNTAHACSSPQTCHAAVSGGPGGAQFNICYAGQSASDAGAD
jgi:hypothetical protein